METTFLHVTALYYAENKAKFHCFVSIILLLTLFYLSAEALYDSLPCSGPPAHEAEDLASVRTPLFHEPHQVTLDDQQREASSQLCLHDLHVSPERAGMIMTLISNLQLWNIGY